MSNIDKEVNELRVLGQRTLEVKQMCDLVIAKEGLSLFELAEQKPEMFAMLYDSCYTMVAELGEDAVIGWEPT